jgi:hypothetical protein
LPPRQHGKIACKESPGGQGTAGGGSANSEINQPKAYLQRPIDLLHCCRIERIQTPYKPLTIYGADLAQLDG